MKIKSHLVSTAGMENFVPRGDGSSRLEALSDGVFSLAIAILLLSSSVPENFDQLWLFVVDIVPFGICMLFIYWIWRQQATFFMRYGLLDAKTAALNMILLFFVLFYVYPLKFLMSWLIKYFAAMFSGNFEQRVGALQEMIPYFKIPQLMIIYSVGFICICLVLFLMYRHAYHHREALGLSAVEEYETQYSINDKLSQGLVGVASVLLALASMAFQNAIGSILAGVIYNLIWVISIFQFKKREKVLAKLLPQSE